MTGRNPWPWLVLALVCVAGASAIDLRRVETQTLVVYTTPAVRDVLEKLVIPAFQAQEHIRVEPVYMSAASEYYRVRLSRERPEADVFLHASPLFIEKGYDAGYFQAIGGPGYALNSTFLGREVAGGHAWAAFAWSPLVEVFPAGEPTAPDLGTTEARWGLPHPLLSNNGVYAAVFFEGTDPAAGEAAVRQAVVQPTNARANIGGVADGSFDLTLGYEAVAKFYQDRGAKVRYEVPLIHGERVTTPVLFCAGLVENGPHPGAAAFIDFLFSPEVQSRLAEFDFRPVQPGQPVAAEALNLDGAKSLPYDWSQWAALEERLAAYEVNQ